MSESTAGSVALAEEPLPVWRRLALSGENALVIVPGTAMISSVAPAAMLSRVTASKQNFMASTSTPESCPISSQTALTRAKSCSRAASSINCSTPSASAISCTGARVPGAHGRQSADRG